MKGYAPGFASFVLFTAVAMHGAWQLWGRPGVMLILGVAGMLSALRLSLVNEVRP